MLARARTADYPGIAEAMLAVDAVDGCSAAFGRAVRGGPRRRPATRSDQCAMGHRRARAGRTAGVVEQGLLLNDFEAQALALPAIPERFLHQIGPAVAPDSGPLVVLGPGTGLGIAALLTIDGRYVPVPSEACHIGFGPVEEDELAFWPYLERARGTGRRPNPSSPARASCVSTRRALRRRDDPPRRSTEQRSSSARSRMPSSDEAETCRCFIRLVARFAGDIAITFLATGGVTLAGGILPRMRRG